MPADDVYLSVDDDDYNQDDSILEVEETGRMSMLSNDVKKFGAIGPIKLARSHTFTHIEPDDEDDKDRLGTDKVIEYRKEVEQLYNKKDKLIVMQDFFSYSVVSFYKPNVINYYI
jgi:hypothetical protein